MNPQPAVLANPLGPRDGLQSVERTMPTPLKHKPISEELVYQPQPMGVDTGSDIVAPVAARAVVREVLPDERVSGHVPDAGLTKGFVYADERRPRATAGACAGGRA